MLLNRFIIHENPIDYDPQENIMTHDALDPTMDEIFRIYDDEGIKVNKSCQAIFYFKDYGNHEYGFGSTSQFRPSTGITYNWDFGDGATYTATGLQGSYPPCDLIPVNYIFSDLETTH